MTDRDAKDEQLDQFRADPHDSVLTTAGEKALSL